MARLQPVHSAAFETEKKHNYTCLRALAKPSIAMLSFPAVFAASSETALAISISLQPSQQKKGK